MRQTYPSDISKEQFERIRHMLESAKKKTRPTKYDLYDIYCAINYVLREGCRWRSLPHDYPPCKVVYFHYMSWRKPNENGMSLMDEILYKLVSFERQYAAGRSPKPTMVIPDSRSVRNADTAAEKGYDAGKKSLV